MGKPRGRRPKRQSKVDSLGNSTVAPLASSSLVENEPCSMEDDEFNDWIVATYMSYRDDYTRKFEEIMKSIDVEILRFPFEDAMRAILEDDKSNMKLTGESNKENNDSAFKVPMGVPKAKKKCPDNFGGSYKSVHFDVESSSTNDSLSDSDVFKTPPKKGCAAAESSQKKMLKTPITSRKEPFAVVTPGPMMNKAVQVLRLPQAGETAVSLSGSPLLVTPFGANGSSQALLTVASENGKLMTIVQPKELQDEQPCTSSPTSDTEMFSLLNDEAKEKIKQFASYLLNNIK